MVQKIHPRGVIWVPNFPPQAGHLSEKNDNLAVQNEDCQWIAVGNVLVNFEQVLVKLNINKLYFIIKGFCSALEILSTSYKCQIDEWISFVIWSFSILMPKTSISWKSIWIYVFEMSNQFETENWIGARCV